MATIAEFSVPAESFALSEALPQFPRVAVEADRVVSHAPDTTMPCLWATDGNEPEFVEAIAADPTIKEVRATVAFEHEHLYHVEWIDEIDHRIEEMIDHEGVILEASGRADTWILRIRFMTREQFEAFRTYIEDRIPELQLTKVFPAVYPRHTRGDVTPEQYEALTAAVDLGYFAVPNEASAEAVADELDISHQAVSERLRRGTENLVRDMLLVEPIHSRG